MKTLGAIALLLLLAAGVWVNSLRPAPHVKAREAVGEEFSYFKIGGIRSYQSSEGPLVILLPSAGREASDFNELVLDLNIAGYETLAIDPRGIGGGRLFSDISIDQMAFDIRNIHGVYHDNRPVVVIGHAYGNRLARYLTAEGPEHVKGVILLAAGGQVPPDPEADAALKRVFNPLKSYKSRMKDVRTAFFAEGNDIPDHWTRGWHTKTAIAQGKAKGDSDDSWHCAGGVSMLIVQPMQDRIAPPANAYALRDKCPQEVEIVEVENAGHALLPEQPEAVANAVLAFLAKHHPTEQNK